jgi:transcriptional regulator with XRE-family HTH domain
MAKKRAPAPGVEEQLHEAIAGCGLSLYQLSEVAGVDRGMLSRFLRHERTLTLAVVAKVCKALGLSLVKKG